jgi:hypothetical protein
MPKQYPIELRQRALRLVAEARETEQYETEWAAICAVASRVGVNNETLRKWLCGSPEIVEGFLCRFSGRGGVLVVDW